LALLVCKAPRWGDNSFLQFSIPRYLDMFCLKWLAKLLCRAFYLREEAAEFFEKSCLTIPAAIVKNISFH